jgi:hypothetical protein
MPAGLERNSFASSRTSWSVVSESGIMAEQNGLSSHELQMAALGLDTSVGMMSPHTKQLRTSTLPAVKGAARQREADLETKKRYFCTACNKGFARKYDWKVHEQRYHEQQFQYPCPDCNQILYAETHFRSHHRDAHGCQQCTHAKEVTREVDARARRTAWGCGFCAQLLDDWEKRCDHISQHYDDGMRRTDWDHTKVIIGLLKQSDLDEAWRSILISKHGQMPNPPLNIKFSRDLTGRSHGDSPGLQDLLELGAIDRNIDAIVLLAYEQGVLKSASSPTDSIKQLDTVKEEQELSISPEEEAQDSIMASPIMENAVLPTQANVMQQAANGGSVTQSPFQQMTPNGHLHHHASMDFHATQHQTHAHPHHVSMMEMTSSPVPQMDQTQNVSMFNFDLGFPSMYQSTMFHSQRASVQSVTDKALPPLPPGASEPSDVNMMQTPSMDMHDGPFEMDAAWPMMTANTGFAEESHGMAINIGTYDPKNQI